MRLCLLLTIVALSVSSSYSQDTSGDPLKLEAAHIREYGNGFNMVFEIRNNTKKPVKAFRTAIVKVNDFNETEQVCDIEFSSESAFITSRGPERNHRYVIQPGKTIFFWLLSSNGNLQLFFSSECDAEMLPVDRNRFKLQTTQVIAVE